MTKLPLIFRKEEADAATPRTIPTRADIPLVDTWDLTLLYPSVDAWKAEL